MTNDKEPQPLRTSRNRVSSTVLAEAISKLEAASESLLIPTPKTIQQAGFFLEEANMWVQRESPSTAIDSTADLDEVRRVMNRVRHLLEGALRVQWIQMRQATAVTQIYMPGGKLAPWKHAISSVDVNA